MGMSTLVSNSSSGEYEYEMLDVKPNDVWKIRFYRVSLARMSSPLELCQKRAAKLQRKHSMKPGANKTLKRKASRGDRQHAVAQPQGVAARTLNCCADCLSFEVSVCGMSWSTADWLYVVLGWWLRLLSAFSAIALVWRSFGTLNFGIPDLPTLRVPGWTWLIRLSFWLVDLPVFNLRFTNMNCLADQFMLASFFAMVVNIVAFAVYFNHVFVRVGVSLKRFANGAPHKLRRAGHKAVDAFTKVFVVVMQIVFSSSSSLIGTFFVAMFGGEVVLGGTCNGGSTFVRSVAIGLGVVGVTCCIFMLLYLFFHVMSGGMAGEFIGVDGIKELVFAEHERYNITQGQSWKKFKAYVWKTIVHTCGLVAGVWSESMVHMFRIARIAEKFDDDPDDDDKQHLAVIRLESQSLALVWFMIPGCAFVGKTIECVSILPAALSTADHQHYVLTRSGVLCMTDFLRH